MDVITGLIEYANANIAVLQWGSGLIGAAIAWLATKLATAHKQAKAKDDKLDKLAAKVDEMDGRLSSKVEEIDDRLKKSQRANIASWQAYIRQAYANHVTPRIQPTIAESEQIHNVVTALQVFDDETGRYQQMVDDIDELGIYVPGSNGEREA